MSSTVSWYAAAGGRLKERVAERLTLGACSPGPQSSASFSAGTPAGRWGTLCCLHRSQGSSGGRHLSACFPGTRQGSHGNCEEWVAYAPEGVPSHEPLVHPMGTFSYHSARMSWAGLVPSHLAAEEAHLLAGGGLGSGSWLWPACGSPVPEKLGRQLLEVLPHKLPPREELYRTGGTLPGTEVLLPTTGAGAVADAEAARTLEPPPPPLPLLLLRSLSEDCVHELCWLAWRSMPTLLPHPSVATGGVCWHVVELLDVWLAAAFELLCVPWSVIRRS